MAPDLISTSQSVKPGTSGIMVDFYLSVALRGESTVICHSGKLWSTWSNKLWWTRRGGRGVIRFVRDENIFPLMSHCIGSGIRIQHFCMSDTHQSYWYAWAYIVHVIVTRARDYDSHVVEFVTFPPNSHRTGISSKCFLYPTSSDICQFHRSFLVTRNTLFSKFHHHVGQAGWATLNNRREHRSSVEPNRRRTEITGQKESEQSWSHTI